MAAVSRVLFLFNHDAAHQAAHIAGIMEELARTHPEIETIAATGNRQIEDQLRALLDETDRITFVDLSLDSAFDAALALPNKLFPAKRLARLRANQNFFASCDVLVSTERTCLRVKQRLGRRSPAFVYVPHGSGDRNVAYHPDLARFDYHLLSGQKLVDEMVAHGLASADQCRIIGYAKFDMVDTSPASDLFANDRPTVLYNPHFDPKLSSWYSSGPAIIRSIAAMSDRFNLVFAPHVMLFRKKLHISPEYRRAKFRPELPKEVLRLKHVLVDLESPALFDMTYTKAADIYIGDVSSQVYEFLRHPRPCFFIDAASQGPDAYPFWQNGPVLHHINSLLQSLPHWREIGERYRDTQKRLFSYTIDHDPERSASRRGADALADIARIEGNRRRT